MSDPSVELVKAVVENLDDAGEEWTELSIVIGLSPSGAANQSYGYGYDGDGPAIAMATDAYDIRPQVKDYLASVYQDGDPPPVKLLVQHSRLSGRYRILFEDTDQDRWRVSPANLDRIREELRPGLD